MRSGHLFDMPEQQKKPRPPASQAVAAYCRGWTEGRSGRPGPAIIGQVSRAAKKQLEAGVSPSVVIDAAQMAGQKGWGAIGFERMVGDLQARQASFDAADRLNELNRRGL